MPLAATGSLCGLKKGTLPPPCVGHWRQSWKKDHMCCEGFLEPGSSLIYQLLQSLEDLAGAEFILFQFRCSNTMSLHQGFEDFHSHFSSTHPPALTGTIVAVTSWVVVGRSQASRPWECCTVWGEAGAANKTLKIWSCFFRLDPLRLCRT